MDTPCCDFFQLENSRIQLLDRYPAGTVILGQRAVRGNLGSAVKPQAAQAT